MSAASPQQAVKGTQAGPVPASNMDENNQKSVEKSLQKENKRLKGDIKQMEMKIKTIQGELKKSNQVKDRLEALCRELQKQNRFIKAESTAKITEANEKGKELAQEVQSNMGFIKNINENLASITSETMQVRKENEELAKKIATLKAHYEEREQVMKTVIDETSSALQEARIELGELKLKNATEREKLLGEMQQLSQALIQSREQMKEAKETEINLRLLLQNYDEKFNGLQRALKDTNGAYEEFKSEMSRVTNRTKELEKETQKWQQRWEESSNALKLMKENHDKLKGELTSSEQSLEKMTGLCRALQSERKDLLEELKQKHEGKSKELMDEVKRRSQGQSQELLDEISRREAKSDSSVETKEQAEEKPESKSDPELQKPAEEPSDHLPKEKQAEPQKSNETQQSAKSSKPELIQEVSKPKTPEKVEQPTGSPKPAAEEQKSEPPKIEEVQESSAQKTVIDEVKQDEPQPAKVEPKSDPPRPAEQKSDAAPVSPQDKNKNPPAKSDAPAPGSNSKSEAQSHNKENVHSSSGKKGKKKGKK